MIRWAYFLSRPCSPSLWDLSPSRLRHPLRMSVVQALADCPPGMFVFRLPCLVCILGRVQLFATPCTAARQAPLPMGFSREEYWRGLPFPSPGGLPHPGIKPGSPASQADSLPPEPPGKLETDKWWLSPLSPAAAAAAAAKALQSCPTPCDPIDGSPPSPLVPEILQAGTLERAAVSFNAWKWKVTVKPLSRVRLLATPWAAARQAPPSMGFSRRGSWSGCQCLLRPFPRVHFCPETPTLCKVSWALWVRSGWAFSADVLLWAPGSAAAPRSSLPFCRDWARLSARGLGCNLERWPGPPRFLQAVTLGTSVTVVSSW